MLLGKVCLCLQGRLVLVQRAEKDNPDNPGLVAFGIGAVKFFCGSPNYRSTVRKIGEVPY